jgi:hypothetical protein
VLENGSVLLQHVSHLVNNERSIVRQGIVGLFQKRALLVDVEDAERDARENVIASRDPAALQLIGQRGRVSIENMHPRIARELALQVPGKGGIELEKQKLRVRPHPTRDFPRMHPFPRPVLSDHPSSFEINLIGNSFNQCARTRHDRRDLEWFLKKAFKE